MKENADYVCGIIAHNLKNFREKQKLSMDQLAALSGVSKSMIGQIERAETNTSISTLWKIASWTAHTIYIPDRTRLGKRDACQQRDCGYGAERRRSFSHLSLFPH